jgi:hypothetical protein
VFLPQVHVFYRVHGAAQSGHVRNYAMYRDQLARFGAAVRMAHVFDLRLRQLGQWWAR